MMILDTNVFSAFTRVSTEPAVVRWLDEQPMEQVWTTSVTVCEVRFGIALLPDSRKRKLLEARFAVALNEKLGGRVLAFDLAAAESAALIAAKRRRLGRMVEVRETQIGGIVVSRAARLATRNIRHFEDLGVDLINPWSST